MVPFFFGGLFFLFWLDYFPHRDMFILIIMYAWSVYMR
jgi:hypothetical protein